MIELRTCLELYEADLYKLSQTEHTTYFASSPREQFCQFIRAMDLPAVTGEMESALFRLSLNELELVWLAIHAESLAYFCASKDSGEQSEDDLRIAHAAVHQIEMVILHANRPNTTRH